MIPAKVDQLFLSNAGFVVLLKGRGDERSLPIFIGAVEAQSIAIWLNRIEVPRPLTHDLLKNVLDCLDCRLLRIVVCDLKDGTFYARLVMEIGGREIEMDSRPSDAIALALRSEAPIYVAESVMDQAGRVFTEEELSNAAAQDPTPASKAAEPPKKKLAPLEILKRDLDKAIEEERYEDAATLRDEILSIERSHGGN